MELILYYIKISGSLIISFLVLIFIIGSFAYLAMRNFKQDSKFKVAFYGLFLGLKNIDIIKFSNVILRTFLVFYTTMIVAKDKVYMCLIMIAILTIMYIILSPKKIVYSVTSSFLIIVMLYFINVINNYMTEIQSSSEILMIKICLIVFVIILGTYFLLRDLDDIVQFRWNKDFEKKRREEVKDGQ